MNTNNPRTTPSTLLNNDNRAVSPVIGVILMVAITVILAAVIGAFVLGQANNTTDSAPFIDTSLDTNAAGDAIITLQSKSGDGIVTVYTDTTAHGDLENAGDSVTIPSGDLEDGTQIRTVYNGEQTSQITSTHEYTSTTATSSSFTCDASTGQYVVSTTGGSDDCQYSSISNAVADAGNGDTVQVKNGNYEEATIQITNTDLTLVGESQDGVVITTTATNGAIYADATSDISKLTIDASGSASGIYTNMYDGVTIDSVSVSNAGQYGVALRNRDSALTNSVITGNAQRGVLTECNNEISGNSLYNNDAEDVSLAGGTTNCDSYDLQNNYWGHNDGDDTNADCTPISSRVPASAFDTSNALCTAP